MWWDPLSGFWGRSGLVNSLNTFTVPQQRGKGRQEIKIKIFTQGIDRPCWRKMFAVYCQIFSKSRLIFLKLLRVSRVHTKHHGWQPPGKMEKYWKLSADSKACNDGYDLFCICTCKCTGGEHEGNAFFHLVQLRNGFSSCYNGTFGHSTVFVDFSLYQNSYIWHLTFSGLHSLGFAPLEGSLMVCWVLIS